MITNSNTVERREFVNGQTGETQGCYAGSELESALVRDPDWAPAKSDPGSERDGQSEKGSVVPDELGSLKREQLNDIAHQLGVDNPEGLSNKDEVIDAINQARTLPGQDGERP